MRNLRGAAVVAALLSSVGFLGAGTAYADGPNGFNVTQSSDCKSHDLNLDVLGNLGIANGILGNALNGEGTSGSQNTQLGSEMGCSNTAF